MQCSLFSILEWQTENIFRVEDMMKLVDGTKETAQHKKEKNLFIGRAEYQSQSIVIICNGSQSVMSVTLCGKV